MILLVASSFLVYFFRSELEEPRRVVLALVAIGFFWSPFSERRLRVGAWLLAVAVIAWAAQVAGRGEGGLGLWASCSVAAALLVVRAGGRAQAYYLPEAGSEAGERHRRALQRELRISLALFLLAYVFGSRIAISGALATAGSAVFFLRYILLQSRFLGIPAKPLSMERGLVPSQRYVVLLLFAAMSCTQYPEAWLSRQGEGPLLLTAALLSVLAALLVVLAVARAGWPRSDVRRTSFFAGILLAVALTAILVELESWDRARFRVFASLCIGFLVVMPFLAERTRLVDGSPKLALLLPPSSLAVMLSPVTAMNGTGVTFPTTVFLFAFALLVLLYFVVVAVRTRSQGTIYLAASIAVAWYAFASRGGGRSWQVFFLAVGFVLYAVDLFERVWRLSRERETIES